MCSQIPDCYGKGVKSFINVFLGMSKRQESCFELGRCQPDAVLQHTMEKTGEERRVRFLSGAQIINGTLMKKNSEHRMKSVDANGNAFYLKQALHFPAESAGFFIQQ